MTGSAPTSPQEKLRAAYRAAFALTQANPLDVPTLVSLQLAAEDYAATIEGQAEVRVDQVALEVAGLAVAADTLMHALNGGAVRLARREQERTVEHAEMLRRGQILWARLAPASGFAEDRWLSLVATDLGVSHAHARDLFEATCAALAGHPSQWLHLEDPAAVRYIVDDPDTGNAIGTASDPQTLTAVAALEHQAAAARLDQREAGRYTDLDGHTWTRWEWSYPDQGRMFAAYCANTRTLLLSETPDAAPVRILGVIPEVAHTLVSARAPEAFYTSVLASRGPVVDLRGATVANFSHAAALANRMAPISHSTRGPVAPSALPEPLRRRITDAL